MSKAKTSELPAARWNVSNEAYHADRTSDSSSTLRVARQSMEKYHALYVAGDIPPFEQSPEMRLGSALHCLLLEGQDVFDERFAFEPDEIDGEPVNRRLKAHREWLAGWADKHGGKTTLPVSDAARIVGMRNSVVTNPAASALLETGDPEVPVTFTLRTLEGNGFPLKAMWDWVCPERGIIMDVKTTRHSGAPDVFSREIDSREYHCQAALYSEAYRQLYGHDPEFYWLFIHNDVPFESYVFRAGQASLEIGWEVQLKTIERLTTARALDHWHSPNYGTVQVINVPDWTLRKFDKETTH